MRLLIFGSCACLLIGTVVATASNRPADVAFRTSMIDPGYGETVAVADVNRDGKPDIWRELV